MTLFDFHKWGLKGSTLYRNGLPVFQMAGVHTAETTPQERRRLRERICRLLNDEQPPGRPDDPYSCDWKVEDYHDA